MDSLFVITACASGGIASMADYICKRSDFKNLPVNDISQAKWKVYVPLLIARITIGVFSGFIMWLILYGILKHDSESYVRLILLSLMAGLSAPTLVKSYQDKSVKVIDDVAKEND